MKLNFNATAFEHDFRFSMLEAYFDTFERQLTVIRDQAIGRVKHDLKSRGLSESDEVYQTEIAVAEHHTEDQFPQIFRSQLLLAIWALIEISMNDTANAVQKTKGYPLSLQDIAGKNPKDKWTKYYSHVLGSPLTVDESLWQKIDDMRLVRNIVAHSGGVRFQIPESKLNQLRDIARRTGGITVSEVEITLENEYLITQLGVAKDTLACLSKVF